MVIECEKCNREFSSEDSLAQHMSVKHIEDKKDAGKISLKNHIVFLLIGLIAIFSIATVYSYTQKAGEYDGFATCLTEKGVVVYGNDFCSYTGKQLNYFGKSDKYLNYVKCADEEKLCNEKDIMVTPTWEINGETYEGVQTFEKLSGLTGCEI